ncbi:MFS transporter [Actinomadura rayongensis]|uniref:MFS transporter n=1 Tax=Actinomadura rayongensis TaxID=1429076 RepID=A0A6I4W798_9ACTN|nr:MFS transporter [Actinomadura rayongensis]MXQ63024.1 MFS transporter [Actinomadura rayongensis]
MLLDALEVSSAVVALPAIGREFGVPVTALHLVMTGFALGFGGLLLFAGQIVNRLGRRPVYLAALVVFAGASLAAGFAGTLAVLVATRVVKGFCAALTAPTGLAIIAAEFPEGGERTRALSVYALFGASGFTVGLLLSGALTELDWRWMFAAPAPAALVLWALARRYVPPDDAPRGRLDAAGAATLFTALLLAVGALSAAPAAGWSDPLPLAGLASAAVLAGVFWRRERSAVDPLVRAGLLAHGPLVRSALAAAALNGAYWGFLLLCVLASPWPPFATAAALLPASVPPMLAAPFSARLLERLGTANAIACGTAVAPLGYVIYWRWGTEHSYVFGMLPALVLVGLSFVLAFAALHVQATGGVAPGDQRAASGLYQTAVQVGGCLVLTGTAVLAAGGRDAAALFVVAVAVAGFLAATAGTRFPRSPAKTP